MLQQHLVRPAGLHRLEADLSTRERAVHRAGRRAGSSSPRYLKISTWRMTDPRAVGAPRRGPTRSEGAGLQTGSSDRCMGHAGWPTAPVSARQMIGTLTAQHDGCPWTDRSCARSPSVPTPDPALVRCSSCWYREDGARRERLRLLLALDRRGAGQLHHIAHGGGIIQSWSGLAGGPTSTSTRTGRVRSSGSFIRSSTADSLFQVARRVRSRRDRQYALRRSSTPPR